MKIKIIILSIALQSSINTSAQIKAIDYKDGEQVLSGFGFKPIAALKDKPGVLILPAWLGIDDHSKESATKLAELGYFSVVADIYGKDSRPKSPSEAGTKAGTEAGTDTGTDTGTAGTEAGTLLNKEFFNSSWWVAIMFIFSNKALLLGSCGYPAWTEGSVAWI